MRCFKTLKNIRIAKDDKKNLLESNVTFIATVNDSTAPVDFLTPAATPPSGNIAENTSQAVSFQQ